MSTPIHSSNTPDQSNGNSLHRVRNSKSPFFYLVIAAIGFAVLAFFIGRGTAPSTPITQVAAEPAHEEGHEDGHESHAGEAHEEASHGDEHGHEDEHGHAENEEIVFEGDAQRLAGIQVAPVALAPQLVGLPFNGSIEASPNHVVRVASVVPGRVTQLLVNIGEQVKQGQTLAIVESRAVGEAQSAYQQAAARVQNARSNLRIVQQQANAGVFSRAPLETARQRLVEAQADVRTQQTAVRSARVNLENAQRLARAGSFASPAIEAARNQRAQAQESLRSAQAGLTQAQASVSAAQAELQRRRQIAATGGYDSRSVQEAQRLLVAAQSARAAAESEVNTTRSNLNRARTLSNEGLISRREFEVAQTAFDTAQARLNTTQEDETAAKSELARQQQVAASNLAGTAEVREAQSQLATAQAGVRSRRAEVVRASESLQLAERALRREDTVFRADVANRRELVGAQTALASARSGLTKAQQSLEVADSAYSREARIYRQNLNTTSQLQAARSQLVSAEAELRAAQTALQLFKSSPNGSARVPIRAPISGVVQEREVTQGEVLDADARLMTIADKSIVHVDMFIPERDIPKVRLGAPVQVQVDAVPNRRFAGSIELIHSQLDPKTRTIEAHAELPNPDGALRFGMFARGTIGTGSSRLAVQVPVDAVQDLEGKKVVFVRADEPNAFIAREVKAGPTSGGQTTITSGLRPGEMIVVKGAFMVKAQAMKAELGHSH